METELYLLKLDYQSAAVGAGSMTLQLAVNPKRGTLTGRAEGNVREGTQQMPRFSADVSGHMHSTGLKPVTRVAAVEGQAMVCFAPPLVGCYLTSFSASFAVDSDWNGIGQFSVGDDTYECKVSKTE